MSLPLPANAKIQQVIKELNDLGVRVSTAEGKITGLTNAVAADKVAINSLASDLTALKSRITALESADEDIRARITALEEKVALLTPCPDPNPPDPEEPPPPDEPDPPEEPEEIHLVATPTTLDFTSIEGGASPAAKTIVLTVNGVGTLNTPAVVSTTDPSGIIQGVVITEVTAGLEWNAVVTPVPGKPAGSYSASITLRSANQTNPSIVIPITHVIAAAASTPLTLHIAASPMIVAVDEGQDAVPQSVGLTQAGTGILLPPVAGAPSQAWVSSVVITGSSPNWNALISFNTDALADGLHSATVAFTSPNATNNPQTLTINLTVANVGGTAVVESPAPQLPRKEDGTSVGWDLVNNKPAANMFDFETIPAMTGVAHLVPSVKTFAQAWADAARGDHIVVAAGTTVPKLQLTPKAGSGWIVIRSANYTNILLSRVQEVDRPDMFTIATAGVSEKAIIMMAQAHGVRIIGAIFKAAEGFDHDDCLVSCLPGHGGWNTKANAPHDFVIDRCIYDGPTVGSLRRGFSPAGYNIAEVGSRHPFTNDKQLSDSQAIGTWEWVQRLHVRNNYLGPATENMMFGGANQSQLDGSYANTWPIDIVIDENEFEGDAGVSGSITRKNLFETKNSERGIMHANVFHGYRVGPGSHEMVLNFGAQAQSGTATAAATMCRHWTIRGNKFYDNTGSIINFGGNNGTSSLEVTHDVEFGYNYCDRYFTQSYGHTPIRHLVRTCYNNVVRNNVFVGWPSADVIIEPLGSATPGTFGLSIFNNAWVQVTSYGWYFTSPSAYFNAQWGTNNWRADHNATRFNVNAQAHLIGGTPNNAGTNLVLASNAAFGFTNLATFDYALAGGSPLIGAGSDGRDIGGQWPTFQANIANVETG